MELFVAHVHIEKHINCDILEDKCCRSVDRACIADGSRVPLQREFGNDWALSSNQYFFSHFRFVQYRNCIFLNKPIETRLSCWFLSTHTQTHTPKMFLPLKLAISSLASYNITSMERTQFSHFAFDAFQVHEKDQNGASSIFQTYKR